MMRNLSKGIHVLIPELRNQGVVPDDDKFLPKKKWKKCEGIEREASS
jgi:hypothetical protein